MWVLFLICCSTFSFLFNVRLKLTLEYLTMGLWVFFLIYCSTFSFLPNVGLRLTLEYLTISPSSMSPSSTLIHSPSNGSILKPEYITHDPSLVSSFTHLMRHACLKPPSGRLSILMTPHLYRHSHTYMGHTCLKPPSGRLSILMTPHLYRCSHTYMGHACLKPPSGRLSIQGQTVLAQAVNHRLWYHLLGENRGGTTGEINKNETRVNPCKGMTSPSTQNLKALGLWVFFLICCLTFSFLLNVGLRLTLRYLTNLPFKWESLPHWYTPLKHEYLTNSHLYRRSHTYTGHACLKTSVRKTFDTGVKLYSSKLQTIGSDTTCWVIRGGKTGEISQEWELSQTHIREWHHLQPKTLRHWVCGSSFLYVAQLSHSYSMWDLDSHLDT